MRVIILIAICGLSLASVADSSLSTTKKAPPAAISQGTAQGTCAEPKFHSLTKYKSERWSRVFADPEVVSALKSLLKTDYGTLKETLKQVVYPDTPDGSLSYVDKNGVLTLEGGVPGLYTVMEAKLVIEPCGHIYAMLLENGERFLFFTNDQKHRDRLPPTIEQWRLKIEATRSQNGDVPKLPVVFKNESEPKVGNVSQT